MSYQEQGRSQTESKKQLIDTNTEMTKTELPDKDFKIAMIKMFQWSILYPFWKKKERKKLGMLSKEIENLITEIKSSIDGQNRGEQQK